MNLKISSGDGNNDETVFSFGLLIPFKQYHDIKYEDK